ncbi:MAG TPA: efflux RND transporter periplasmic adaptor subunit [Gemmatimonadales bacterium]|nr:efflux RND transporter periplasmic adaptor subunit [Gemmatimonadales bacterium]
MTRKTTLRLFLTSLCFACGSPSTTLSIPGTVEIRDVRVSSLTAGRLVRLFKDEGDSVRRGDTVALLEQPGLSSMIGQRRAQAEAARHRTADVAAAVADSARAANDVARSRPLRDRGIVSSQQFDALTTAAAAATARLQATRAALSEARAASEGVASTEAIQNDLVLMAPAAGVVLTRYLEPGEVAGVGMPIVSIGVVADPWVRAYVGEPDLPRVHLGAAVSIRADGVPGTISGRIVEIAPRAEFTPRAALTDRERADLVFAIKVSFVDPAGRLKAGLPVTLDVPLTP